MATFIMVEKENFNSERKGVEIEAKTLTAAKIKASKQQAFYGTFIELTSSSGETLAVKEKDGTWIEQSRFM